MQAIMEMYTGPHTVLNYELIYIYYNRVNYIAVLTGFRSFGGHYICLIFFSVKEPVFELFNRCINLNAESIDECKNTRKLYFIFSKGDLNH